VSSIVYMLGLINYDDINLDKNHSPMKAYCHSKLANILFAKELAKRLKGTNVTTYSLHPGIIRTELGRHIDSRNFFNSLQRRILRISPELGAQTTLYCALDESVANESGFYYE
jgi:retinol dehydrogenase 12